MNRRTEEQKNRRTEKNKGQIFEEKIRRKKACLSGIKQHSF
jgi:hypothetical protein